MRSLDDLQRAFASYLLAVPGEPASPELESSLRAPEPELKERLAIYKNNVYVRLIEALEASYPVVHRLVGDEFFRFAARQYIPMHPPRLPTLLGYGATFPEFLNDFEPASSVPYLADVARLEQLYLDAYHAAEARALAKSEFLACLSDAARASPRLHPAARLMCSQFPVSRIWEINRQSTPIEGRIHIPGETEFLLVVRPRETVEVRRVPRGAYAALGALAQADTLARAVAAGRAADPQTDIMAHLTSLAEGETFISGANDDESNSRLA